MNEVDDRSAGRWCAECQQHGSHHTDKHAEFAPSVSAPTVHEGGNIAAVLAAHREDSAYPDTCVCETDIPDFLDNHFAAHLADTLEPLIAERERAAAVQALSEAAREWSWGEWTALTEPIKAGDQVQRIIGAAQAVTDWLRERRDRAALAPETPGDAS